MNKQAEKMSKDNGLEVEVNQAYIDLVGAEYATADNAAEAYQGQYRSDEDFVEQLLEDLGTIPNNLPSYIHTDWEKTAYDVMMDYMEEKGFYFRSL